MDRTELATLIERILLAENDEARLAVLADVDLDAAEAALVVAGNEIATSTDQSDDVLETLGAIVEATEFIRAERTRRDALAAERADALSAIQTRLNGEPGEALADGGNGDDDADEDETTEVEVEVEVEVEATPPVTVASTTQVGESLRTTPSLGALARAIPAEAQPVEVLSPRVSARASMDVPNYPVGTEFPDLATVADALIARVEVLGQVRNSGVSMEKVPVVRFSYRDQLTMLGENMVINGLTLRKAGEPNALTASGGFCAPGTTVYDFVKINTPSDLTQDFVPTVGAPRGSTQYPDSPDIRDAFAGTLSRPYSNAEDIAGASKITAVIACPSFNTCTVGAQYVILQFGNFGTMAYPEWVQHWIQLAMDVHAHLVSRKLIYQMVALSNAAVAVGPNAGATSTVFSNIHMAAADYRQDLRMSRDAPLDIVIPSWTYNLIRSDLARARKGGLETLTITDAQINAWFGAANLTPHPVTDWQEISGNSATGATVWPSGLDFLVYAPGTFVKLDMGTLDLGTVRDSVLNETNDYNIFVETFESICKPGLESRLYSTSICANGAFSADQNLNCAGIDIPGS